MYLDMSSWYVAQHMKCGLKAFVRRFLHPEECGLYDAVLAKLAERMIFFNTARNMHALLYGCIVWIAKVTMYCLPL